jgi:DNA primase
VIDTAELLRAVDLGALIERDLGPAVNRSGRWLFWHCPFHNDPGPSLAVTPDNGRYYCFGCGASGDAITWLRKREGLSFLDACKRLGALDLPKRPVQVMPPPLEDDPPSTTWQERASVFVDECEVALWSKEGTRALSYLRDERGLADATIRQWRLGYNPAQRWEKPEMWGLDTDDGQVCLPRGLAIPCRVEGILWYVKVRRPIGKPKYLNVKGGKSALFGADLLDDQPVVLLCEGEFDAMLSHQQAGDLVGVAALGSATKRIGDRWIVALLGAQRVLTAFDTDRAGEQGAARLLMQSQRVRRVRPLQGNDLTDFHQAGGDLRAWVIYYLERLAQDASEEAVPIASPDYQDLEDHLELVRHGMESAANLMEGRDRLTATYRKTLDPKGRIKGD